MGCEQAIFDLGEWKVYTPRLFEPNWNVQRGEDIPGFHQAFGQYVVELTLAEQPGVFYLTTDSQGKAYPDQLVVTWINDFELGKGKRFVFKPDKVEVTGFTKFREINNWRLVYEYSAQALTFRKQHRLLELLLQQAVESGVVLAGIEADDLIFPWMADPVAYEGGGISAHLANEMIQAAIEQKASREQP